MKIPDWLGASIAYAISPPKIQKAVKAAFEEAIEREKEEIQAMSLGVSIEEYRIIKGLLAQRIDWSKLGKRGGKDV
jgi:hypothetical protein